MSPSPFQAAHRPSTPSALPTSDPFNATAVGNNNQQVVTKDSSQSSTPYNPPVNEGGQNRLQLVDPTAMKTNETAMTRTTAKSQKDTTEDTTSGSKNVDTSVLESFRDLLAKRDEAGVDDDRSSAYTEGSSALNDLMGAKKGSSPLSPPAITEVQKQASPATPKFVPDNSAGTGPKLTPSTQQTTTTTTTTTKVARTTSEVASSPHIKPLVPSQIITTSTVVNAVVDEYVDEQSGDEFTPTKAELAALRIAKKAKQGAVLDPKPNGKDIKASGSASNKKRAHTSASTADRSTEATEIDYADMLELNDTLDSPAAAEILLGLAGGKSGASMPKTTGLFPPPEGRNRLQQPFTPTTHTGFIPEESASSIAFRSPATQSSSPIRESYLLKDPQSLSRYPQEEDAKARSRREGSSLERQNSSSGGNVMVTILSSHPSEDKRIGKKKGMMENSRKRADSQYTAASASKSANVVNTTHNTVTTVLSHNATPFDVVVMPDGTRRLQFRQGSVLSPRTKKEIARDKDGKKLSPSRSSSTSTTSSSSSGSSNTSIERSSGESIPEKHPTKSKIEEPSSRSPIGSIRPPLMPASHSLRREDAFGSISHRISRDDGNSPTKRELQDSARPASVFRKPLRAPSADSVGETAAASRLQEPLNQQQEDFPVSKSRGPGGRGPSSSRDREGSPHTSSPAPNGTGAYKKRAIQLQPPSYNEDEKQISHHRPMAPIGGDSHPLSEPYTNNGPKSKHVTLPVDSYVEEDDEYDEGTPEHHPATEGHMILPSAARDWISSMESDRVTIEGGLRTLVAIICAQRDEMLNYCALAGRAPVSKVYSPTDQKKRFAPLSSPNNTELITRKELPPTEELMDSHFALIDVASKVLATSRSSNNQYLLESTDPISAAAMAYHHTLVERDRCLQMLGAAGILRTIAEVYSPKALSETIATEALLSTDKMKQVDSEVEKAKLKKKLKKEALAATIFWQQTYFGLRWEEAPKEQNTGHRNERGKYVPAESIYSKEILDRQLHVLSVLQAIADGKAGLRYLAACAAQEREDLLLRFVES